MGTQEKIAADKTAAAAEAKKVSKEKRVAAYKSAEKYVKEYRSLARARVRMHRQAKAAGNHYVEPEAKLMFVVRIRELIYKRGFGKVNKQRLPLNDNSVVEAGLGKHGIICMEDLVHEIVTVGPHFTQA